MYPETKAKIDRLVVMGGSLSGGNLDVKLLTTVAGNVSADKTTLNALKLVEFFGVQDKVPVATGAQMPLLKHYQDASHVHGASGMPGWDFTKNPRKNLETIELICNIMQS
ncbi:nucleoside hydrolase [Weissella confusa]|uniref:Nucleoside hydrolase n=1 Tax=Weissella confusa TaxID=1583 RepID=A0A923SSI7_WEICO|nr:nucleoside hydrolase [Weissella confusa]